MLQWTAVTAGGISEPVPRARLPHAATLIGGALLVLALFVPIRVWAADYVVDGAVPFVLATVVIAALVGLGLVGAISRHLGWLVAGLVLLDVFPVILVLTAPHPLEARARVVWLVIPTVLAAANSRRLIPIVPMGGRLPPRRRRAGRGRAPRARRGPGDHRRSSASSPSPRCWWCGWPAGRRTGPPNSPGCPGPTR